MGNPRASYAARTVPDKADVSARSAVASNPSTPADVLRKLARDRDWRVRADAASNPSAPADALRKLAEDED